jgi:hypothetical protein
MIHIVKKIIENRIQKVPFTNILKNSFGYVGGAFGFFQSLKDVFKYENGFLLRPVCYTMIGGSFGFVCGLYPFHCLGLFMGIDAIHFLRHNSKYV